jgi:hypothetical protein
MHMLKYIQLPYLFDVLRLQSEVQQLAGAQWLLHYQTKHFEGEWRAIPLRSIGGKSDDVIISPLDNAEYSDTEFLHKSNYLREVLSVFKCPLKAVRLLKLDAGSVIKEHRDADLSFEKGEIRIHIPVVTNDKLEFYLDKEMLRLKEGECWYMNFNLPHSIYNKGNTNRIHLVIDAIVNDWVKDLFDRPGLLKKEIEDPGIDDEIKKQIISNLRLLNSETANRMADEMEATIKVKAAEM